MNRSSLINRQFICYLSGLLILAIGSNLFLKADLGVAPSCTIALALTRLFPVKCTDLLEQSGYALK